MSGLIVCMAWRSTPLVGDYALFGGGYANSVANGKVTTYKYGFSDNVMQNGTTLSVIRSSTPGAIGNREYGVFGGGSGTGSTAIMSTDKYVYASDVRTVGGTLGSARYACGCFGNSVLGFMTRGFDGSAFLKTSVKYTYATTVWGVGSVYLAMAFGGMAFGNDVVGVSVNGNGTAIDKYTYASGAVTAGGSLVAARTNNPACVGTIVEGHSVYGQQGTGIVLTCEIYAYATSTTVVRDVVGAGKGSLNAGAAANGSIGVITGGQLSSVFFQDTSIYNFVDSSSVVGTLLSVPLASLAGISSVPANF